MVSDILQSASNINMLLSAASKQSGIDISGPLKKEKAELWLQGLENVTYNASGMCDHTIFQKEKDRLITLLGEHIKGLSESGTWRIISAPHN